MEITIFIYLKRATNSNSNQNIVQNGFRMLLVSVLAKQKRKDLKKSKEAKIRAHLTNYYYLYLKMSKLSWKKVRYSTGSRLNKLSGR